jgi:hypothetical protein
MSDALPMVKVVANSARGWRWINERDFDPNVHSKFGDAAPAQEEKRGPGRPKSK